MFEVRDKVFFITGAAAGIGAAIVRAFLEEGAKVSRNLYIFSVIKLELFFTKRFYLTLLV